jgi:DNA-binding response OmpR family regulator
MMSEPYRVLYIDDDKNLLDIAKIFLEIKEGFFVNVTTSPVVVLESLHSARYDAILSDYEMPVMNGIELLKAVRKDDPTFPFILFTGRGREEVVIDALNYGANFYLQKGGGSKIAVCRTCPYDTSGGLIQPDRTFPKNFCV